MGTEQVRVGGVWMNEVGPWGDLVYSTAWPKGCDQATWSVYLPVGRRHEVLRRGAFVEINDGVTVWTGKLSQVDWSTGSFTADGLYVDAAFTALDGSGAPTTIPSTAVDQAIIRGADFTGRSGVATTALTASTTSDSVNTVGNLLSADADLNGKRWGVFADGVVLMAADATTPSWHLDAGSVELGEDDSDYASRLFGRYTRDTDNTLQNTPAIDDTDMIVRYGPVEATIDLTPWGPISTGTAMQITQNILDRTRRSLGWTNAVEVSSYQLTTPGGQPADLSMVKSNQVVRAFDVWDGRRVLPYADLLLGRVSRSAGSRTINLAPVDTQPQTLADVIASMQPKEVA